MRYIRLLMLTLVLAGCGTVSNTDRSPAVPKPAPVAEQPKVEEPKPIGAPPPGAAEQILAALQSLSPQEALRRREGWVPGLAVSCHGDPTAADRPVLLLVCQWGPAFNNMMEGRILAWYDGAFWRMAPYPQEAVRGVGYFMRIHQIGREGREAVVIMNVARGMTMGIEQVQLLRYDGQWRLVWAPAEWTPGHARVAFLDDGYRKFEVNTNSYNLPDAERGPFAESNAGNHRLFRELWEREGDRYIRRSRMEIPTPYGALVHFVTALVRGDEQGAVTWATSSALVQKAKQLGIAEVRGEFIVRNDKNPTAHEDERTLRLMPVPTEQPQWLVTVRKQADRWVVIAIK